MCGGDRFSQECKNNCQTDYDAVIEKTQSVGRPWGAPRSSAQVQEDFTFHNNPHINLGILFVAFIATVAILLFLYVLIFKN